MKTHVLALGGISITSAVILASVALLGIHYVAADATTTEPTEPEVIEQPEEMESEPTEAPAQGAEAGPSTTATIVESVSSTTEPAAEPAASTSTSTPSTISAPEEVEGTKPAAQTVVAEVAALQDAYFQETGGYLQVLPGNGLPTYETGTVAEKLGKNVADDAWVHIYEAPAGKGYQVFYEADGVLHSVGYGPEAAERTFSRNILVAPSATSTAATAL
jgi:hypothetical protein